MRPSNTHPTGVLAKVQPTQIESAEATFNKTTILLTNPEGVMG